MGATWLTKGGIFNSWNWEGKAVNEITLSFYNLYIQHTKTAQRR